MGGKLPVRLGSVYDPLNKELDRLDSPDLFAVIFQVLALGAEAQIVPHDDVLHQIDELDLDADAHLPLEDVHSIHLCARTEQRSREVVTYDAPLDEGNGGRFNGMLQQMAELSQFIVITHNKKTMEAVDTLYGVTMPDPGVSRLVSVQIH